MNNRHVLGDVALAILLALPAAALARPQPAEVQKTGLASTETPILAASDDRVSRSPLG